MPLPTTSNVTRPKALGYSARLDDLYLRLAPGSGKINVETAPLQAPRISTAENPEDLSNEFGQIFSRSDFSNGEGLAFAHRRGLADAAGSRFWDSKGIDVAHDEPGQPPRLRLLPATATIETSSDTNLHLAYDGTAIYMSEGTMVRRSTDFLTAGTPSFADSDPHAGEGAQTVLDLCSIGSTVYAAITTNGIHKHAAGGAWAHLSATAAVKVWAAKGYLLASTGTVLSKIDLTTGASTTLITLAAGSAWTDVTDAGAAILAAATDGYIYALTVDPAGAFTLHAQTLIDAPEQPYALTTGPGGAFVLYATYEPTPSAGVIGRLWRAALDSTAYVLTDAQLVRQWGTAATNVDQAPRVAVTARDGSFVGVQESSSASYLWRYDAATAGRVRHLAAGSGGLIVDALAIGGRLFFTVAAVGLRREASTYAATGYLMSPLADFFTAEEKSWAGALIDVEDVPSGTQVELYYATDADALFDPDSTLWTRIKNLSDVDTTETALRNVDARYLAGMVKVTANTAATSSPSVRAFAFRAYPGPGDVIITLPVSVSDQLERPGKRRLVTRGLGALVYDALKDREGRYAELELLQPGELLRGVVEQVSTPVPQISRRGSVTLVSLVTFRGRRSSEAGASESAGAVGVGSLGVMTLGGVEVA